jgi:hypothetical protein
MADTNATPETESGTLNVTLDSMSNGAQGKDIPSTEPSGQTINLARTMLDPLNHGMAAGTRKALELGVPVHAVIEMQLNHIASTVAQLEPAGLRLQVIEDVVRQLASLVRQHVDAKNRTAGGIILPRAGA